MLRHYFIPRFNLLSAKLTPAAQRELLQLFDIIIASDISILKDCRYLQTMWSLLLETIEIGTIHIESLLRNRNKLANSINYTCMQKHCEMLIYVIGRSMSLYPMSVNKLFCAILSRCCQTALQTLALKYVLLNIHITSATDSSSSRNKCRSRWGVATDSPAKLEPLSRENKIKSSKCVSLSGSSTGGGWWRGWCSGSIQNLKRPLSGKQTRTSLSRSLRSSPHNVRFSGARGSKLRLAHPNVFQVSGLSMWRLVKCDVFHLSRLNMLLRGLVPFHWLASYAQLHWKTFQLLRDARFQCKQCGSNVTASSSKSRDAVALSWINVTLFAQAHKHLQRWLCC